jgi:uncharacterized membrane protein
MEALLFHPKIVHLPIALGVLMPLVAAGSLVAWWRGWLPARSWVLAIALQAVLVGSGVLALRTGQAEEERVETIVSEQFIEAHEEAAEVFVWVSGGVLGIMLLALAMGRSRERAALAVATAATLGTLVVFGLGYRTGNAGGALVYRHGAAQAYVDGGMLSPGVQIGSIESTDDDDDDDGP